MAENKSDRPKESNDVDFDEFETAEDLEQNFKTRKKKNKALREKKAKERAEKNDRSQ